MLSIKNSPADRFEAEPAGGKHAEEMAAGEKEDVAAGRRGRGSTTRSARAATWAGDSPPGQPSRNSCQLGFCLMNLGGAEAFVVAVVPFDEVGVDCGDRLEASKLASAGGALEGAGEDFGELEPWSRSPSWRACCSPRSVSGKSVRPVCWPERLQAVSACRAR